MAILDENNPRDRAIIEAAFANPNVPNPVPAPAWGSASNALLGFGASMLNQGPSPVPISFGQQFGQGLLGAAEGMNKYQQQYQKDVGEAQALQMNQMKMQQVQADMANKQKFAAMLQSPSQLMKPAYLQGQQQFVQGKHGEYNTGMQAKTGGQDYFMPDAEQMKSWESEYQKQNAPQYMTVAEAAMAGDPQALRQLAIAGIGNDPERAISLMKAMQPEKISSMDGWLAQQVQAGRMTPEQAFALKQGPQADATTKELNAGSQALYGRAWETLNPSEKQNVMSKMGKFPAEKMIPTGSLNGLRHPTTLKPAPVGLTMEQAAKEGYIKVSETAMKELMDLDQGSNIIKTNIGLILPEITANTPAEAAQQAAKLHYGAFTRTNDNAKVYKDFRDGLLGTVSKGFAGEAGVLTNQDLERVSKLFPEFSDTKSIATKKAELLNKVIDTATRAKQKRILGYGFDEDRQELDSLLYGKQKASAPNINTAELSRLVVEKSNKYGVDPKDILGIMKTESNLQHIDPKTGKVITSPKGALGYMQLMPDTAKMLGVDPLDPEQNIEGGIKYYAQMLKRYNGDKQKAIAAYNAGPGAVDKAGGVPNYKETKKYVPTVQNWIDVGNGIRIREKS